MNRFPDPSRWEGRRVLVTGNTGFKGSWLTCWLRDLGAEVVGLSLPEPPTSPSLWEELDLGVETIRTDIRRSGWASQVRDARPQVVFHLAAQSIVAEGYRRPGPTFDTNVMGTARLLEALTDLPGLGAVVVVTTDKVYDPRQPGPHREAAFLGGQDPYAASKAATELLCSSWPDRSFPVVTARAGNVVGGGDWSVDRLVPDLVRAWESGADVVLRDPRGVRPWQHVVEPLRGYILYAEQLLEGTIVPRSANFGPSAEDMIAVGELVEYCASVWRDREPESNPGWRMADVRPYQETAVLTIGSELADAELGWRGILSWRESMDMTLEWYLERNRGRSVRDLVVADLGRYIVAGGGFPA